MKFPSYLTKKYIEKTYGSFGGVSDLGAKLTAFSKTATTLKATIEFNNGMEVAVVMKTGTTKTSITVTTESSFYKVKFNYSTEQTKNGIVIKANYTGLGADKLTYRLDLEKDGDFSKFRLQYGAGDERVTVTSTKIAGNVVTFKAVDADGDVIGTAKINLKTFADYYDKDTYLFDSGKTSELFGKLQLKFTELVAGKAAEPDLLHDTDLFIFEKSALLDDDHDGASLPRPAHAAIDAAPAADDFDFLAPHHGHHDMAPHKAGVLELF